jgi:hypothetical protein
MYYLPPRLLVLNVTSIVPFAFTTTGMGNGDPLIGNPFQWTVTFNVTAQSQSSLLTPTPYSYTGNDVVVGDWIADLQQALATKIVQIISQNPGQVVAICEDVDHFNIYTDPTGSGFGIGVTGTALLFTLNDDGMPVLGPMTSIQSILSQNLAWQMDQHSRFQYRNYVRTFYRVHQIGHAFSIGDVLVLGATANGSGVYSKVTANTASVAAIVGQVNSIAAPTPDWFTYRPNGRLVTTLSPALPGRPGDLIYLAQGGLSNVAPTMWSTPLYIQLEIATTGIALSRGIDTAGSLGYASRTYVVADQSAANATLVVTNTGDQVMVDNAGFGEWTHYVVRQNNLRPISTQDSARVDADSLEVIITPTTPLANVTVSGGGAMGALLMGNVSAHRSVTMVNVQITAPFSPNSVISIGTTAIDDLIMPNALIDLTILGSYSYSPTVEFSAGYTQVYAFVNYNGTTIGNATITVTYV